MSEMRMLGSYAGMPMVGGGWICRTCSGAPALSMAHFLSMAHISGMRLYWAVDLFWSKHADVVFESGAVEEFGLCGGGGGDSRGACWRWGILPGRSRRWRNWRQSGDGGRDSGERENHAADPIASLWFIRAGHLFAKAGGDTAAAGKLRELSKQMLQDFIAGRGLGGVKMDDGGLLIVPAEQPAWQGLRLNALWYSALESTTADLKGVGDKSGDHFERLAGRFRRAFAKQYWCDGHNCICPYRKSPESHGEILDVEQLVLTVLHGVADTADKAAAAFAVGCVQSRGRGAWGFWWSIRSWDGWRVCCIGRGWRWDF